MPDLKIQQFWGPFLFAKALSTRGQIGRKSVSVESSRKNSKTVEFQNADCGRQSNYQMKLVLAHGFKNEKFSRVSTLVLAGIFMFSSVAA